MKPPVTKRTFDRACMSRYGTTYKSGRYTTDTYWTSACPMECLQRGEWFPTRREAVAHWRANHDHSVTGVR